MIVPRRAIPLVLSAFLLLAACAHSLAATNSAWFARSWFSDDGLPNNSLNSVAQTPDGFLWVATSVGLARFDGVRFQELVTTNFASSENRGITGLLPDGSGGLWLS